MAVCDICLQEMTSDKAVSCKQKVVYPDGVVLDPIPYDSYDGIARCADCNVVPGGLHHPGCDNEKCPRCGGQLITCGCF